MQKFRAVLFDLDNTLSDFMQMKAEACKAGVVAMVAAGLKMPVDEAYSSLMEAYFAEGLESDQAFSAFLLKIGQFDHKILAAAINSYLETKKGFLKPYPNVCAVLDALIKRGYVLGVVTDAPKTKAYQRLLAMDLEQYFEFVLGFEDTGAKKQTGLPLKLALDYLRKGLSELSSSDVLMVGDSVVRDLYPAKSLGLKTALSLYGQWGEENVADESVDFELSHFGDLLKILE
jgi:putative hydrolase of the HAD superfamily